MLASRLLGPHKHLNPKSVHARLWTRAVKSMAAKDNILSENEIWPGVLTTYQDARTSGASTMTETQVQLVHCSKTGVDFVVRLASALKAKPKAPEPSASTGRPAAWKNPFLPPEPALTVGHLSETHTLVLNKFNVVPHHCLVITREFESQTDPLNAHDLGAAWRVLKAMPSGGLAFYNCGEHSGRSQPHKHMQVVPLPFHEASPPVPPVQPVVDVAAAAAQALPYTVFEVRTMPCQAYASLLKPDATPAELESVIQKLMARLQPGASYNVVMTCHFVMLCPRRSEMSGPIALNSLAFAGTVLVRSPEEVQFVEQQGPATLLAEAGQPWETATSLL